MRDIKETIRLNSQSCFSSADASAKARDAYLDKKTPKETTDSGVKGVINPHLTTDSQGNQVDKRTGAIVWPA